MLGITLEQSMCQSDLQQAYVQLTHFCTARQAKAAASVMVEGWVRWCACMGASMGAMVVVGTCEMSGLHVLSILSSTHCRHCLLSQQLNPVLCSVLRGCQEVEQAALADVIAVRERDPACTAYSSALLYYKGYHALQTHRIAHGLWERGQTVLARSLQVTPSHFPLTSVCYSSQSFN